MKKFLRDLGSTVMVAAVIFSLVFGYKAAFVLGNYMESRLSQRDLIKGYESQIIEMSKLIEDPQDVTACTSLLRSCYTSYEKSQ